MKNTIKMSLVAALAVAGFSTAASAGSLEEAIKGVSISGKMEVGMIIQNLVQMLLVLMIQLEINGI
jgi:hypothetical protein